MAKFNAKKFVGMSLLTTFLGLQGCSHDPPLTEEEIRAQTQARQAQIPEFIAKIQELKVILKERTIDQCGSSYSYSAEKGVKAAMLQIDAHYLGSWQNGLGDEKGGALMSTTKNLKGCLSFTNMRLMKI